MLGPTHRAFATTAIAGTLLVTPQKESPVEIILALTVAWFSATLPDIDKKLPEGYHRTWTHAIWIPLLIGYGFYNSSGIVKIILLSLFISYMSHLIGDAYSKAGIAWLYPFQQYVHEPNGRFYVKGKRGIFIPLYTVGKSKLPWSLFWYLLTSLLLTLLILQM